MPTYITNEAQLKTYLAPKISAIVKDIMDNISELNLVEINKIVYKYTPQVYERTYEFRDAWEVSRVTTDYTKPSSEGKFEYDSTALSVDEDNFIHGSYDGDAREALAEIIYQGVAGSLFGEGYWTKSRDAWSALVELIPNEMEAWVTRAAKKQGLKIKWLG